MTILVSARNREALVIGADSQESSQAVTQSTVKLLRPHRGLALAWAGYKDVAQAMWLSLRERPLDLAAPRSEIAQEARDRFRQVRSDPDIEHRSDVNEFLLGWFSRAESRPVALHLRPLGPFEWVERWHYVGSPSAVAAAATAQACINYIATDNLGPDQLSIVALKVLRDSIDVAPPSALVGGDPQLAIVTAGGVRILGDKDLRTKNHALDGWEEQCADLLPGAETRPADVERVDRGLGPPT